MPNNYSKLAIGLAAIILVVGAFYVGRESNKPNTTPNGMEVTLAATSTATTTRTATTAIGTKKVENTTKITVSPSKSYTPVLTRIVVTSRGNTTILRCTGVQAIATGFDQNGAVFSPLHVTWSSSDPNIAVIDQNGVAISSHVGRVILTARSGTISGSMTISVIDSIRPGAGLSPCPGPRR